MNYKPSPSTTLPKERGEKKELSFRTPIRNLPLYSGRGEKIGRYGNKFRMTIIIEYKEDSLLRGNDIFSI
ncbi:TPA: hypothetical protein DCZ36_01050 [Candidatus Gracilibacteria bacterium]|nr:hypothetical protein [Candidatus Gracilibacteria bacterium]